MPPTSPSLKVIVSPLAGAMRRGAPLQVVEALAGSAMVTGPGKTGKVSVNDRPVTGVALPLVIVKVIVLTLPGPMVLGVKTLEKVGWAVSAVKLSAVAAMK